ncbi:MAG TPA: cyclic nucleotide-binding domain-containing protein [Acidimicrobiales bacterium]
MLRRRPDVSAFAGVALFDRYDARTLAPLAPHADRLVVTPGQTLVQEGHRGREVVVILSGEAIVTRSGVEVGRLGPGAVLGAREELAGTPHATSVVAAGGVSALVLTGRAFRWAAQALPGFEAPVAQPRSQPRRRGAAAA